MYIQVGIMLLFLLFILIGLVFTTYKIFLSKSGLQSHGLQRTMAILVGLISILYGIGIYNRFLVIGILLIVLGLFVAYNLFLYDKKTMKKPTRIICIIRLLLISLFILSSIIGMIASIVIPLIY